MYTHIYINKCSDKPNLTEKFLPTQTWALSHAACIHTYIYTCMHA